MSRHRGEFSLIRDVFGPLARHAPGALALSDDAALIEAPAGQTQVVTADAMVAGVHFATSDPPDLVARKLLRVNLSDLAAMGAAPAAYTLVAAISPEIRGDWIDRFAQGLAVDQAEFGISLIGGDTVATPGPPTFCVTAIGWVPDGNALRRNGASPGDRVFVSGTIGDGALGLGLASGELVAPTPEDREALIGRLRLPSPRVSLGRRLHGKASAAIDISDGLVADLGHLCRASGVGANVFIDRIPLSGAAQSLVAGQPALIETVITGGDDYELLFAVPASQTGDVAELARELDMVLTDIGEITAQTDVVVRDSEGVSMALSSPGFQHF